MLNSKLLTAQKNSFYLKAEPIISDRIKFPVVKYFTMFLNVRHFTSHYYANNISKNSSEKKSKQTNLVSYCAWYVFCFGTRATCYTVSFREHCQTRQNKALKLKKKDTWLDSTLNKIKSIKQNCFLSSLQDSSEVQYLYQCIMYMQTELKSRVTCLALLHDVSSKCLSRLL